MSEEQQTFPAVDRLEAIRARATAALAEADPAEHPGCGRLRALARDVKALLAVVEALPKCSVGKDCGDIATVLDDDAHEDFGCDEHRYGSPDLGYAQALRALAAHDLKERLSVALVKFPSLLMLLQVGLAEADSVDGVRAEVLRLASQEALDMLPPDLRRILLSPRGVDAAAPASTGWIERYPTVEEVRACSVAHPIVMRKGALVASLWLSRPDGGMPTTELLCIVDETVALANLFGDVFSLASWTSSSTHWRPLTSRGDPAELLPALCAIDEELASFRQAEDRAKGPGDADAILADLRRT